MEDTSTTRERRCKECDEILRGRTDKQFCNDGCRNSYNRKKRHVIAEQIPETYREIFRIIKQNHLILLKFLGYEDEVELTKSRLVDAGFHFKYFTSTVPEKGMVWHCCFDIGWGITRDDLILSTDRMVIRRFHKEADPSNFPDLVFG
ncbi:hypothetical protein [Parapedobacter sp. DT-150]|uniref:hypothetical protein n=1 Tax=Parapedobacter sp. DT-150 TaxID=3396162 RepID=UPI003F541DA1